MLNPVCAQVTKTDELRFVVFFLHRFFFLLYILAKMVHRKKITENMVLLTFSSYPFSKRGCFFFFSNLTPSEKKKSIKVEASGQTVLHDMKMESKTPISGLLQSPEGKEMGLCIRCSPSCHWGRSGHKQKWHRFFKIFRPHSYLKGLNHLEALYKKGHRCQVLIDSPWVI